MVDRANLHIYSTISDGQYSPAQLAGMVREQDKPGVKEYIHRIKVSGAPVTTASAGNRQS